MDTLADSRVGAVAERAGGDAVLVVGPSCEQPCVAPVRVGLAGAEEVFLGRGQFGVERADGGRVVRVGIDDGRMSSVHARLIRGNRAWRVVDEGSRNGTVLNGVTVTDADAPDDSVLEVGRTFLHLRLRADEAAAGARTAALDAPLETFNAPLRATFARLVAVARADVSVLLLGPTGTGKEVAARALHDGSGRAGAFVAVNCGALPAGLVENELFGHVRGAFTGATEDAAGLVRAADGGTLFLDEIGELAPASQAALLRVLQEREVRPVGSAAPVLVDVRVVAATLTDASAAVERGVLRPDLYARLAGAVVQLPRLRDRREDLGILMARLLARAGHGDVRFDPLAMRALFAHDWPLNVRELDNALRSAVAIATDGVVSLEHLPDDVQDRLQPPPPPRDLDTGDRVLRAELEGMLATHGGNVAAVARAMGKAPMQIYRWLRRLDIDVAQFRRR